MNFRLLLAILLFSIGASPLMAEEPRAAMPEHHFEVFDKYCLDCHDSLSEKGGVNLEDLDFELNTIQSAELWQKILNTMNSGEMPPEDKDQLNREEKTAFLQDLSHELVVAREVLSDTGGVITMRRLNRREYENTIEALLGVEIDASDLPADTNSDGFDTTGSALFFSSDQFEQYLSLARQALSAAFVLQKDPPKTLKHRRESETSMNRFIEKTSGRLKAQFDQASAWRSTEGKQEPKEFGFIDEDDVMFNERLYNQQYKTFRRYLDRPESESGVLLNLFFNGAVVDKLDVSPKWPAGDYVLRARVGALPNAPSNERFLEYGLNGNGGRSGELQVLGYSRVTGTIDAPQVLEIPISVGKTGPRSFGLRQRQHNNRDAARATFLASQIKDGVGPDPSLWVDWIEIEGPIVEEWPPRAISKIFFKGTQWWTQPDQSAYAREIIERFAKRAFRLKDPSPTYLEKLYALHTEGLSRGLKFHEAIQEPLAVILASPGFLYLIEPAADAEKKPLSDLELAVRLSYFLWSAPPDQALIAEAQDGRLRQPKVLAQHADRLLDDSRADDFLRSFAHQWLHMDRLDFFQFDHRQYPEFDESAKEAARTEVSATMRSILDNKRPLGDLLKADYVVINDLLADYYDIPDVDGSAFRKVEVGPESPRGGLLGMAAIMAMGSDGTESSPVERGVWVMRTLLHDPPPPAPANVPQLSRIKNTMLTPRQKLDAHMEEAQCAQCHQNIDPIGHGLQNFDAAGQWRDEFLLKKVVRKKIKERKTVPIDPAGQLPDGEPFADYYELRDAITGHGDAFARGFAEALIEYALGRPYGFSDQALRERILDRANAKNGEMREIILALIASKPFQTKK